MELYVGLDVSLDMTAVCVLDGAGKVIWRGRCSSTPDAIACLRAALPQPVGNCPWSRDVISQVVGEGRSD